MQTVNFQCGHCGNLMAVTPDMLGRQVRCPHCQQVVHAPEPAAAPAPAPPPPAPAPAFYFAPAEERESIFAPDEHASEDVFGAVPRPVLEMPPPPVRAPPPPAPEPMSANPFAGLDARPIAPPAPAPQRLTASEEPPASSPLAPNSPWGDGEPAFASMDHHADFAGPPPQRVAVPRNSGWLAVALIVPLISYAVLATILIIILYNRGQNQPHPLEMLPDLDGDNVGARRVSIMYDRTKPDIALPARLRVGLGRTVRVGDLEVTPLRVEQAKIRFLYPNGGGDPARHPSLILHLQLRNVSDSVAFKPTDPEFHRAWDPTRVSGMPYTFLEMGHRRFYGGPIKWIADNPPGRRADIGIDGANLNRELRPGESMNTLVCTHPELRATEHVNSHQGKMLWRVQVRRGLVQAKHRELPATAVIGVEFTRGDIQALRG